MATMQDKMTSVLLDEQSLAWIDYFRDEKKIPMSVIIRMGIREMAIRERGALAQQATGIDHLPDLPRDELKNPARNVSRIPDTWESDSEMLDYMHRIPSSIAGNKEGVILRQVARAAGVPVNFPGGGWFGVNKLRYELREWKKSLDGSEDLSEFYDLLREGLEQVRRRDQRRNRASQRKKGKRRRKK